jgi:uncharacterized phage protein (TIGR02218 family)
MIPMKSPMKSLTYGHALRYSTCWAIERTDGAVLRVCNHNSNLTVNGFVYHAASGFATSARERGANLQERNVEVRGYLTSDFITEDDLRAGFYRDAKIIESVVNWRYPWAGIFSSSIYFIQQMTYTSETWQVQIIGFTRRLQKARGDTYGRMCRWDLGEAFGEDGVAGCKVNLEFLRNNGSVTEVTTQRNNFKTTMTGPDNYYNRGIITWTSGANIGIESEIQSFKHTDGKVVLFLRTPYDIAVADTFSIIPGCNHVMDGDCKNVYNNVVNFGGQPYIPGTDRMVQIPPPKN